MKQTFVAQALLSSALMVACSSLSLTSSGYSSPITIVEGNVVSATNGQLLPH